jgi:Fic family protein
LEERFKNLPDKRDIDLFFKELVSFLSWLQHQFVVIHPFNDYNGRIARLLTNMLLLRLELPLIEIKIEEIADRDRYIESMKNADNFDYTLLEGIIYDALREALERNI